MAQTAYSRSELRTLIDVQRYDSEIHRLRAAIERAVKDPGLQALRDLAVETTEAAQGAKERVGRLKHSAAYEEKEADGMRAEVAATERKMYGGMVASPKELEKMGERVEQLRSEIGKHEEASLAALEELEQAEPAHAEAVRRQEETGRKLAAAEGAQKEAIAGFERQIKELEPKRADVATRVPAPLLLRYERIRDTHAWVGAATIRRDGLCGACLVEVPRALARAVLDGTLETCETCGRMLVHVFEATDPTGGQR